VVQLPRAEFNIQRSKPKCMLSQTMTNYIPGIIVNDEPEYDMKPLTFNNALD